MKDILEHNVALRNIDLMDTQINQLE